MPGDKELNIEEQIEKQQRDIKYDTKEYTVEIIVDKYLKDLDKNDNEFFVPDYQREFVWDDKRQSKYIESLIMGLPTPYIFLAEDEAGRSEIVDGSQRIRTLAAFLKGDLTLRGLEKLTALNNVKFSDLSIPRQRKIKNISLKMISLSAQTTAESKTDIFERINRGSDLLKDMESRKGIYPGKFNEYIAKLAKDERFVRLTPIGKWLIKRKEREELILRFFAFRDKYPKFNENESVTHQLDEYYKNMNAIFSQDENCQNKMNSRFYSMLNFIDAHTTYGFAKNHNQQVSRVYFEALSIGVSLALDEKPNLNIDGAEFENIVTSSQFMKIISGKYYTHTPRKLKERIDYIKKELIK